MPCDTYEKAIQADKDFQTVLDANPGTLRYVRHRDNEATKAAKQAYHNAMEEWRDAMRKANK